ncbi:hypothetical protein SUGI_0232830 [Cryptomeria japonica]|uniref:uncharacterized protein LOC131048852 n=1 Tax=Cryptomeria japonica TaxID=3369 RepID=UPI002408C6CE|nr:uncharacterized protein LOC131048852 [Cryptomeria japonica]GLJ14410.1 hypothetical protein SUGI_0232830 [Cryptomeria japonica]
MSESDSLEDVYSTEGSDRERNEWCNDVHKYVTLEEIRPESNETSPCILRVSEIESSLLKECEDAYLPQIVSIGPYHARKEEPDEGDMEIEEYWEMDIKEEAVSRVVVRILLSKGRYSTSGFNEEGKQRFKEEMRNLSKQMVTKFTERADDIKRCYHKATYYSNEYLGEMMVLDACFILEFFRCLFNESVGEIENLERFFPKFGSKFNPVERSKILKDLIKLENQIPLFVLEEVLSMEMRDSLEDAKSRLQVLLKAVFQKFYYRPFDYVASGESLRRNHILDVYYYYCLGDEGPQVENQSAEEAQEERQKAENLWIFLGSFTEDLKEHQFERLKVPSAVQLQNGGVKIQANGKRIQDIFFEGKTLNIPPIQLESDSEIFIRNLIALEMCSPYGSLKRMTAFAQFMNELCQTEKEASVMRENGVIVGNLWQHSEVTRLFSSCKQSHSLPTCYPIEVTREKLLKYYSRKSRIAVIEAWNEFRKTYFPKPWLVIGGIGATIILMLTAVQVFCLFYSCGAH